MISNNVCGQLTVRGHCRSEPPFSIECQGDIDHPATRTRVELKLKLKVKTKDDLVVSSVVMSRNQPLCLHYETSRDVVAPASRQAVGGADVEISRVGDRRNDPESRLHARHVCAW